MKHSMTIAMLGNDIALLSAKINGMNSPVSMTEFDCELIRDMKKRIGEKCAEMATLISEMEDPQPINLYSQSFNDQIEAMRKRYAQEAV